LDGDVKRERMKICSDIWTPRP